MKQIIQKAIEGGWGGKFTYEPEITMLDAKCVGFSKPGTFDGVSMSLCDLVMQKEFWQALGKACGWNDESLWRAGIDGSAEWYLRAMTFHEINLTEGWDKAVKYLEELVHGK